MKIFHRPSRFPFGVALALLTALVAGCGGGMDPILGTPVAGSTPSPPTITATAPAAATPPVTDVATSSQITVTFSRVATFTHDLEQ